jgi:hypothetical protein
MTQKFYLIFWVLLFSYPLSITAQVTLEKTYPTTDLHRVNWTFGGEKYWFADDTLKEIKIYSAQHQLEKTIRYPSVSNAQVRLLQGDYGVTQTTINADNLLEMVWLIRDTVSKQTRFQIVNELNTVLFSYDNPFETVSFSEIEGLDVKLFVTNNENYLSEFTTRVYSIPSFQLETVYFRAFHLHRKNFQYSGEKYFYKDITTKRIHIYNNDHTIWKSIGLDFLEKIVLNKDESYTDADDGLYIQDSLVEVSFSYYISDNYAQAIINENKFPLYKSNVAFRVDIQKGMKNKLFSETYKGSYPNQFKVFRLPNSLSFQEEFLLSSPIARAFIKKWGETFFTFSPNEKILTLSYNGRRFSKDIILPTIDTFNVSYSNLARTFQEYFYLNDTLINTDNLIEIIHFGFDDKKKKYATFVSNDTGYIYQIIDSTRFFNINNIKGLSPKLFTKTGNNNPYNTKVWRLGGATTPIKETPSVLDIKIYPNPSRDEMTIELLGIHEGRNCTIAVYNTLGQIVYTSKMGNSMQWRLKKEQIGKGLFVMKIVNGNSSISKNILFD